MSPRSALTRDTNNHLATFMSLSGCLDKIVSMQCEAKDISNAQLEDAKKLTVFVLFSLAHSWLATMKDKDTD